MAQITTPEFPESVYEASVGAWFKSEGDEFKSGEALLELHTDKATQEINAIEDGVLTTIFKQVDDIVQPGDALCEVEPVGANEQSVAAEQTSHDPAKQYADGTTAVADAVAAGVRVESESHATVIEPSPVETSMADDAEESDDSASDSDVITIEVAQPIPMGSSSATQSEHRVSANVVELDDAETVEDESGADESQVCEELEAVPEVEESGVGDADLVSSLDDDAKFIADVAVSQDESQTIDRETLSDDRQAADEVQESASVAALDEDVRLTEARASVDARPVERVRLTRRQLTAARRMVQVKQETVMTTTFNEVDMHAIIEMRSRHGERFLEQHGVKLGFMAFFIKAACAALKAYPVLNAEIDDNELVLKRYYDIGIAVASDRGLVVPVIRDADSMTFAEIESAIRGFATQAQSGSWQLSDLAGGTFTITNGGVFGSMLSTPILNPPQVGILGMHNIVERPIAVDGKIAVRPMMYLALTYDHRIVEGAQAVQFLRHIKTSLESADALLLGT